MGRAIELVVVLLLLAVLAAPYFGEVIMWAFWERFSSRLSRVLEDNPALVSALGDPGMRSEKVRVAVEGWDFCNRAGDTNFNPSPRWADCADLSCPLVESDVSPCTAIQKVSPLDNNLKTGDPFPAGHFTSYDDPDSYAVEKEKYLGYLCEVDVAPRSWDFWMIMLKNGNFDEKSGRCSLPVISLPSKAACHGHQHFRFLHQHVSENTQRKNWFPCFGPGCMNQPLVYHNWSRPQFQSREDVTSRSKMPEFVGLAGGFYGTYDLDTEVVKSNATSFFSVHWYKKERRKSWNFHHELRVSHKYPWLMLYLRADATSGLSGGYPWDTRGMMVKMPKSPNFKVELTLDVIRGGGPQSQFYLLDIGGCWKNSGEQCDGDTASDVTRYSEMIINPDTPAWCGPNTIDLCPPTHTSANGTKIHREDIKNFPYRAYHLYCVPHNAKYAEQPFHVCDPYSNPQPQEILQLLPHPEWAVHGYPACQGEGWVGNPRTWELDVGALSSRLYFYQDPKTPPAIRKWPSIDVGTEIYISSQPETAEWIVSDFNVLVPETDPS